MNVLICEFSWVKTGLIFLCKRKPNSWKLRRRYLITILKHKLCFSHTPLLFISITLWQWSTLIPDVIILSVEKIPVDKCVNMHNINSLPKMEIQFKMHNSKWESKSRVWNDRFFISPCTAPLGVYFFTN